MSCYESIDESYFDIPTNVVVGNASLIKKIKLDSRVCNLVVLYHADRCLVGKEKLPPLIHEWYDVEPLKEKFALLFKEGFIRCSTAKETLRHLKSSRLKELAKACNVKQGGRKEEVASRIERCVREEDLQDLIPERYWELTDKGKTLLQGNKYLDFYFADHKYSLYYVDLDIGSFVTLFSKNPFEDAREVLREELCKRIRNDYPQTTNPKTLSKYFELYHVLSSFWEEEGNNQHALHYLLKYVFYTSNYVASYKALKNYSVLRLEEVAAGILYLHLRFLPGRVDELVSLLRKCEINSDSWESVFAEFFRKQQGLFFFSPERLACYIHSEITNKHQESKLICQRVMRDAIRDYDKWEKILSLNNQDTSESRQ